MFELARMHNICLTFCRLNLVIMLHISQQLPKSFRLKMLIMLHIPKVLRHMVMLGLQAESARKDIQHI